MTDSSSPQTPLIRSVSKSCALSPIWCHAFFVLKLYGRPVRDRHKEGWGGATSTQSLMSKQAIREGVGGSEFKGIDRGRAEPNSAMKHILLTS